MHKKRIASLAVMILFLSSCTKKKESATAFKKQLPVSFEQISIDDMRKTSAVDASSADQFVYESIPDCSSVFSMKEQEARYADIPTPFAVTPYSDGCCDNERATILRYATQLEIDQLGAFYKVEMERLGWFERFSSYGVELLMLFEKPARIAIVSVRPSIGGRKCNSQNKDLVLTIEKL